MRDWGRFSKAPSILKAIDILLELHIHNITSRGVLSLARGLWHVHRSNFGDLKSCMASLTEAAEGISGRVLMTWLKCAGMLLLRVGIDDIV